jgi:hypothetical protein
MRAALVYLAGTRHPWPCLLFVMPLLLLHEGGMVWLRSRGETLPTLTGVEAWIRDGLDMAGLNLHMGPSLAITAVCIIWAWLRWKKHSPPLISTWVGIAVESVLFALGLWGLWAIQGPLMQHLGLTVPAQASPAEPTPLAKALGFIGTGIYEETLFRLVCLSLLAWLLRWVLLLKILAAAVAIIITAALFAIAHQMHWPFDQWNRPLFIFHTMAGLVFGLLYVLRGFGVAVGAHACFNVMASLATA